ncbi:MAG: hypothetical protein KDE35_05595 [Geminicoccaceae bacterium]|nr:hypothetical protein [Geminicoccaceae bacterium]
MTEQVPGSGRFERPSGPNARLSAWPSSPMPEPPRGQGTAIAALVLLALLCAGLAAVVGYGYTRMQAQDEQMAELRRELRHARTARALDGSSDREQQMARTRLEAAGDEIVRLREALAARSIGTEPAAGGGAASTSDGAPNLVQQEAAGRPDARLAALQAENSALAQQVAEAGSSDGVGVKLRAAEAARAEAVRAMRDVQARNEALVAELAARSGDGAASVDAPGADPPLPETVAIEMSLLQRERDAARAQVDQLLERASSMSEQLTSGDGQRSADEPAEFLQTQLSEAQAEIELLRARIEADRTAQSAADAAGVEPGEVEARIEALTKERDEARERLAEIQRLQERTTIESGEQARRLAAAMDERETLQAQTEEAQATMQGLRDELEAARAQIGERDEEIAGMAARLRALEERRSADAEKLGEEASSLEADNRRLREEIEALRADLQEAGSTLAAERAAREADPIRDEVVAAKRAAAEAQEKIEALTQQLEQAKTTEEELRARVASSGQADTANLALVVAERNAALEAGRSALVAAEASFAEERARLQERIEELEAREPAEGTATAALVRRPGATDAAPASSGGAADVGELEQAETRLEQIQEELQRSRQRLDQMHDLVLRRAPQPPEPAPR